MLSLFAPWSADECISAFEPEGKKAHQGVAPQNLALHQGIAWSNSTSALGLRTLAVENRVGSRCTGKERDSESDLDNFGARYYASTTGRFMSPDWALKPIDVPYAKFGDPQTLNLYAYVENSPLNRVDADGHQEGGVISCSSSAVCNSSSGGQDTPLKAGDYQAGPPDSGSAQNQSSGGFWQKLGNALSGNGWKTDSEVKQGQATSPTTPIVAAGAGLAPGASGAAQAAKDAAKNFMKSTKPDPPLRGLPGETPDATKLSPLRQLVKDALDTAAGAAAGLANGATEVVAPILAIPHVVLHPTPDPKDPDCGCST